MNTTAGAVRAAVARHLRFRRRRWFFYVIALLLEAGGLFALGNGPALLIFLTVFALPTLIPVLWLGRYRLPDEEWQDSASFAEQIANVKDCFATHMFFRHRYSRDLDEEREIRIVTKRSTRGIRGKNKVLAMYAPGVSLLVTPRSYWVQHGRSVHSGDIACLGVDLFSMTKKVRCPLDEDEVLGSTWQHATKRGEQDLRYRNNWELWEVRRYGVELSFGEYRWNINLCLYDNACKFANAFSAISMQGPAITYTDEDSDAMKAHVNLGVDEDEDDKEELRQWHDVLGVAPSASIVEIKSAYRNRLKEYHPDRVAHLGEKLRLLADQEATAINQAYEEAMRQRR